MTKFELEAMVARHEMQRLEFKESCDAEAIETACSFANANGGFILIGVTDAGQLSKKPLRFEALRDYENKIATATEPRVSVDAEKVPFLDGEIVLLKVAENPLKPVAVKGRSFIRKGSVNHQMTPSEIAECHLKSTGSSMDAVTVPGVTKDDLDMSAVRRYMQKATIEGRRAFTAEDDPWTVLKKLRWVKSETEITQAAYLLFAKDPQEMFPQAIIHAGAFKCNGAIILDAADMRGNIQDQIEAAIDFIRKNTRCAIVITGKAEHDRYWEYPLGALRETLANAICHRDYRSPCHILLKIMEDHLTVYSPGELPFDISMGDFLSDDHSSHPRNRIVAQALFDIHAIEQYGSGVTRIRKYCNENGNECPTWKNGNSQFVTTYLPRAEESLDPINGGINGGIKSVENNDENAIGAINGAIKALTGAISDPINDPISDPINGTINGTINFGNVVEAVIRRVPGINRESIATKTGKSVETVKRAIAKLIEEKRIAHRGSKKTGGYFPYDAAIDEKEPVQ